MISHGFRQLRSQKVLAPERLGARFWVLSVLCATLPDIDVLGFAFGVQYKDVLGHRGLTHSLPFALLLGCVAALLFSREAPHEPKTWLLLTGYYFIVAASHGLLDAMTNGGLGVAFFAPFSNARYFLPWRPIEVSAIGLDFFFSSRSLLVLWSEIKWIWIPSAVVFAGAQFFWKGLRQ